jgi:hypothetical protein
VHKDSTLSSKTCCHCKTVKAITEFAIKITSTGQRQSRCKECQKIASRAHYEANRGDVIARSTNRRLATEVDHKTFVAESLHGQACTCCGTDDDLCYSVNVGYAGPRVSSAAHAGMARETLLESIANSTVMCRTCRALKGASALLEYTRKKADGQEMPANPVTRAEYKERYTHARVDRRQSEFRDGATSS